MSAYAAPRIRESRHITTQHRLDLEKSAVDFTTAAFAGLSSVTHEHAHDMGIRGDGELAGLCFRYWQPVEERFSDRFIRIKPDAGTAGHKYLQPVGERPALYFPAGTTKEHLRDVFLPVLITEGEKKVLATQRALHEIDQPGLVIGIGGVWAWRYSPRETQPDGKLGKGKSRPIPDLDLIVWKKRIAYLILDSDVQTNSRVAAAENALASELWKRGAKVYIVRITGGELWKKSASMI